MTINRCRTSEKWLEATLRKRVEGDGRVGHKIPAFAHWPT